MANQKKPNKVDGCPKIEYKPTEYKNIVPMSMDELMADPKWWFTGYIDIGKGKKKKETKEDQKKKSFWERIWEEPRFK